MTPRGDDGADAGRRRRGALARAATEHLPYKTAALFFALALWLVVASGETAERMVPVRVEPRLEEGLVLAGAPATARAVVVGRARDLAALGDGPLVARRVVSSDSGVAAAVRGDSMLLELRPADVDLPSRSGAVVRDVQPRVVTIHVARSPRTADAAGRAGP